MSKSSLFAVFILSLAAAAPSHALAADGCDLTPQVAELTAVQTNASMDELEQLKAEIVARRKLAEAAMACDKAEISSRLDALGRLPEKIKEVEAHGKILEKLDEATRYYDNQRAHIQNLGVWDQKSAARNVAAWRRETFIPLLTWADNFLLWADNQQFLEKGSERLGQVSRVAFSLSLVNQDRINDLFKQAQTNFDAALAENDKAKRELDRGRPGLGLIHLKTSLAALSETYQIFFELQKALQEIVP